MQDNQDSKKPKRPVYNYDNDTPKNARAKSQRVVYDVEKHMPQQNTQRNAPFVNSTSGQANRHSQNINDITRQTQLLNNTQNSSGNINRKSSVVPPTNYTKVPQGNVHTNIPHTAVPKSQNPNQNRKTGVNSSGGHFDVPNFKPKPRAQQTQTTLNNTLENTREQSIAENKAYVKSKGKLVSYESAKKRLENKNNNDKLKVTTKQNSRKIRLFSKKNSKESLVLQSSEKSHNNFKAKKAKKTRASKEKSKKNIVLSDARTQRKRRKIIMGTVITIIIFTGIILSFTVLFGIEGFVVEQETIYSDEQIINASGIEIGENLFLFNTQHVITQMRTTLPYLDEINISRIIPGSVKITATNAVATYSLQVGSNWLVLSDKFIVLETKSDKPPDLVTITGVKVTTPYEPGFEIVLEDGAELSILKQLQNELAANALAPVDKINLENLADINFVYDDRILVVLGNANELEEKINFVHYILNAEGAEGLSVEEQGTLDVSSRDSEGRLEAAWQAGTI